jgi:hypothetical protein
LWFLFTIDEINRIKTKTSTRVIFLHNSLFFFAWKI